MAETLLNGVNEVMKRAKLIQGDSGTLTSLTDSPRQVWIDQIVQIWNELMEELYSVSDVPMPTELSESTITLVEDTRNYTLDTFNTLNWPFIDETTGQYIYEQVGGYSALWKSQPIPSTFTGLPLFGAIRETDGDLYLDRLPTATEAGLVYKYRFHKDISVSTAAATFPFKDEIFRALVPAAADLFKAENRQDVPASFNASMGRAARLLSNAHVRSHYGPRRFRSRRGVAFPFDHGPSFDQ